MNVTKKTVPYSDDEECKWDEESRGWLFSWDEEIPDAWVVFSIEHEFPVESINAAFQKDSSKFELDVEIITKILEDD